MQKLYLFMAAAALSCMASFGSMATETDTEALPVASAVGIINETATDTAADSPAETQPSTQTEQETAPVQEETKETPIEDVIKDYEQGLKETERPATEAVAEQEAAAQETETTTETEAPQTEAGTEPETGAETEQEYIEVPSDGVTEAMQEIYSYLRSDMGFSHAAACGIIANIKFESDYDPTAVGDGGSSYGLCQWHNGRYSALISYCGSNGLDGNSISGQMAFLSNELSGGFQDVLEHMRSVPDNAQGAYDAAYYWCKHFEMPYNMEACAVERANFAQNDLYGKSFTYKKTMKKTVADIRHELLEDSFVEAKDEEVYQFIINMVRRN